MGELDKAIGRERASRAAAQGPNMALNAIVERTRRVTSEFADHMRAHEVGKMTLYIVGQGPHKRRGGFLGLQTVHIGPNEVYENAGDGWVIEEADRYSDSNFSWIVLDQDSPRLVECDGPIAAQSTISWPGKKGPPILDPAQNNHPPFPYVRDRWLTPQGELKDVLIYDDQAVQLLAAAAVRLTTT